jgi:DNA-binding transcriptional LysR family regulator
VQPSDGAVEWILSQQCDLGFASPPQNNPAIAHRLLKSGPSVCLLPADHHLCDREVIRPDMLEGEGFISFRPDSVYRYRVEEVMRKAEVRRIMRYEARTTDAVCGLVSAGLGLAVVGPFLPRFRVDDRIVVKPFRPVIEVELSLLWSSQRPLSAVAERFIREVDAYFADPAR